METDAKGSWHNGIAEAWSGWTPIVTGLKEYAEALQAGGKPTPCGVTTRPDGQVVVDVGPAGCALRRRLRSTVLYNMQSCVSQPVLTRLARCPC